uniref:Glucosamine-6-phosphate deaminase n=1 Tax=Dermatophagoides pteronyssinus TaxID=6956 RepID=A0A6P6YD14_DERPT|nr:uncharacterized protein LOC113796692 [Dermatophagoides pteronyssinus]
MQVLIFESKQELSKFVAEFVIAHIKKVFDQKNRSFVLATPTGGSVLDAYKELSELGRKNTDIDWKNVHTFALDEYCLRATNFTDSYKYFLKKNLLDNLPLPEENKNFLNYLADDLNQECKRYESKIEVLGNFDLFIGGIGRNGHIAFNEPPITKDSKCRIVELAHSTIEANKRFFNSTSEVPTRAMTIGFKIILKSKLILLIMNKFYVHFEVFLEIAVQQTLSLSYMALDLELGRQKKDCLL